MDTNLSHNNPYTHIRQTNMIRQGALTAVICVLILTLASCTGNDTSNDNDQSGLIPTPTVPGTVPGGASSSSAGSSAAGTTAEGDTGGTTAASGSTAPAASDNAVDNPGLNLLVSAEASVRLKRQEWSDYYTAGFGAELHRGDLLRVSGDATALVLCDGLTTWEVPAGAPAGLNNGCPPPPEPILVRGSSLVGNTRGGNDPRIPYVISPRKTKLLTAQPLLRWNPVPDATSYGVSVRGEGVNWSTTTEETEIDYPGDPPLQPGQTYALIVTANTGASSRDEGIPGLGFTLLTEAEAADVQSTIDKIKELELGEDAQALAITQFMVGQEMISEGIATLEGVVAQGSEAPAVYRMLGDLNRRIGLNLIAAGHYESAIEFAEASDNIEDAAAARVGLAEVNISLGDQETAIQLLQQAIDAYQTLGDAETVAELEERLASL